MKNNTTWAIVYNPKAGTRRTQKKWNEIKSYLDLKGVEYEVAFAGGFGTVEPLVKKFISEGFTTLVVIGGDGAINDAINGIMNSSKHNKQLISLGIIANGIGNDIASYWGITADYKQSIKTIIQNRQKLVDVGYCRYFEEEKHQHRYFLNSLNIGLGARIVRITDQMKRFFVTKWISYLAALLLISFVRQTHRAHLHINEEKIRGRVMTICIGNGRGYGQTPSAVPYDGWLDVSVIYRPALFQRLNGMWMLVQGRLLNHKRVKSYRTKYIKVFKARNSIMDLDGRIQPNKFPLEIGIIPEAIRIIIPS